MGLLNQPGRPIFYPLRLRMETSEIGAIDQVYSKSPQLCEHP